MIGVLGHLDLPRIISPVQQRLALPAAAVEVAAVAVLANLGDVPFHGFPAFDLPFIVLAAAAHVIAAVPLEPPARILFVDPTFFAPDSKRLRGVYAEVVELGVVPLGAQFGVIEPVGRELLCAIGHVLAAEDAEFEHLFRRELRLELGMKVLAHRLRAVVNVLALHFVADDDANRLHGNGPPVPDNIPNDTVLPHDCRIAIPASALGSAGGLPNNCHCAMKTPGGAGG